MKGLHSERYYQEHGGYGFDSAVNRILNYIAEVFNVDVEQVTHDIVEHEEAGRFLDGSRSSCAYEV